MSEREEWVASDVILELRARIAELTEVLREAEVCGDKLCVSCQRRIRTALSTASVPEVSTIAGEEAQP